MNWLNRKISNFVLIDLLKSDPLFFCLEFYLLNIMEAPFFVFIFSAYFCANLD
jgi:hypothetical protein